MGIVRNLERDKILLRKIEFSFHSEVFSDNFPLTTKGNQEK